MRSIGSIAICVSLACLAVNALACPPPAIVDEGLTISILLTPWKGDSGTLNLEDSIQVKLTNSSDHDIQIWNPNSRQGYYLLKFETTNLESNVSTVTSKREIKDEEHFNEMDELATTAIKPHQALSFNVSLLSLTNEEESQWLDIPEPYPTAKFSIRALYVSPSTDSTPNDMWTGEIKSEPASAKLITDRIWGPLGYLEHNLPKSALRFMENDRSWINGNKVSNKPLHLAARYSHLEVVKWLLENGADVNATNNDDLTPLHEACDPEIVKLILKYKPDMSKESRFARELGTGTPLQAAAINMSNSHSVVERKDWELIVNLLLEAGAECDIVTAIHRGDVDRVRTIMRNKPPSSDDDWDAPNPLRLSASLGQLGVCRCLIDEFHQDINQFELGRGPIMRDSLAHPEVVALLLKSGADVHKSLALRTTIGGDWISDDATALHFAAQEGVPGTITLLLDNGIDMLARTTLTTQNGQIVSQTALDVAAYYGRADNMEAMVTHSKFAEIDKTQRQELLDRCIILGVKSHWYEENADRPNLIKVLLDNGANPNAANGAGLTPIQAAVLELSPNEWRTSRVAKQIAVLLRERGAKLDLFSTVGLGDDATVAGMLSENPGLANERSCQGRPALNFAVEMNYTNIVRLLIQAGVDVNIRPNATQETSLHVAAWLGRNEIAKLLIEANADVNAVDYSGDTPLHRAVGFDHIEIVRLLLDRGASANVKNKEGKTPIDDAESDEIKQLLLEHLGK